MDLYLVVMMMRRNRKRLLWAINAVLAAAVAGAGAAALLPLDEPAASGRSWEQAPATATPAEKRLEPLTAYAVIYQGDLRAPLFKPKSNKVVTAGPLPMPPIRLTGTAVEPDFGYGMFRTRAGQAKMVAIGESIEGAKLAAVTTTSATLRYQGRLITVPVEKPGTK